MNNFHGVTKNFHALHPHLVLAPEMVDLEPSQRMCASKLWQASCHTVAISQLPYPTPTTTATPLETVLRLPDHPAKRKDMTT